MSDRTGLRVAYGGAVYPAEEIVRGAAFDTGIDPVVSSFLPCCPAQAESDSATIATATPVARRHRDKEKVSCIVIEAPAIQSCTGTPDKSGATFTPAIIC